MVRLWIWMELALQRGLPRLFFEEFPPYGSPTLAKGHRVANLILMDCFSFDYSDLMFDSFLACAIVFNN